jgi:pimeloyl-ACP methyl ester carboxylesterase
MLVMLNGKSASREMWHGMDAALAATGRVRVVNPDQRGSGLNAGVSGDEISLEAMADDVWAVADAEETRDFHLLGASTGGLVAQLAATRSRSGANSGRVLSLTLVMTAADLNGWATKGFEANSELFMRIIGVSPPKESDGWSRAELVANRVRAWAPIVANSANPDADLSDSAREQLVSDISRDVDRGAIDWGDAGGNAQQAAVDAWTAREAGAHRERLRSVTVPTLVLHGRNDPLIPVDGGRELAGLVPGARFVEYDGGHNLPLNEQGFLVGEVMAHVLANAGR